MTKIEHECEDCEDILAPVEEKEIVKETYSDDNCICYGEVIVTKCPRHGNR